MRRSRRREWESVAAAVSKAEGLARFQALSVDPKERAKLGRMSYRYLLLAVKLICRNHQEDLKAVSSKSAAEQLRLAA